MHNTLTGVTDIKQRNSCCISFFPGGLNKLSPAGHQSVVATAGKRIYDVIHGAKNLGGIAQNMTSFSNTLQRNTAGSFVQKNPINRQQGLSIAQIGDGMEVPQLFEQRFSHDMVL